MLPNRSVWIQETASEWKCFLVFFVGFLDFHRSFERRADSLVRHERRVRQPALQFDHAPSTGMTLVPNSSMERITCSCLKPPKLNMPTRQSGFAVSIICRAFLITVSGLPISDVPHSSIFCSVKPPGK